MARERADPLAFLDNIKVQMSAPASGKFTGAVKKQLDALPASLSQSQGMCLQSAAAAMSAKVDSLYKWTIKGHAHTQRVLDCFNPELLQTSKMVAYPVLSKAVPGVPKAEWEKYVALNAPQPKPSTTSERSAWWRHRSVDFPTLSSIALFFVRRPRSACYAERVFSLIGHILSKNRLCMGNTTLRNLAIMYVNKDVLDEDMSIHDPEVETEE